MNFSCIDVMHLNLLFITAASFLDIVIYLVVTTLSELFEALAGIEKVSK
jgi:hypothetical protein